MAAALASFKGRKDPGQQSATLDGAGPEEKKAYEALHPETVHGAAGNGGEKGRQLGDSTPDRFTTDTAARTGRSERAVQRDAGGDDCPRCDGGNPR